MPLFTRKKQIGVQSFILKLVNNNCSELQALLDGPRVEHRANLTVVVLVIPVERGRPALGQMFAAVTKEVATAGLSVVLDEPKAPDEVILAFRWETQMRFIRAQAKHLNPMGAGFYQLGFEMTEMVHESDYPELQSVSF